MKEEDDECQEGSVAAQKRRTKTAWQTSFLIIIGMFTKKWDVGIIKWNPIVLQFCCKE